MKDYIDEKVVEKLSLIPISGRSLADGLFRGVHSSRSRGQNLDFREHREYIPGDDLKKIDWKVSGKKDKLYIREYEEDVELTSFILIDSSHSMSRHYTTNLSKFEYAKYIAATLSYLFVKQRDKVIVGSFGNTFEQVLPKTSALKNVVVLNHELNKMKTSRYSALYKVPKAVNPLIKSRTLFFLISDFIIKPAEIYSSLSKINSADVGLVLFHLFDESERTFPFKGETIFQDPETNVALPLHSAGMKKEILHLIDKHKTGLKSFCRERQIEYREMSTEKHYSENLFSYIKSQAY